jgi:5,10-methylenetetrahydrofolate reductase
LEIVPHITVRRYKDFDDIHKTIENFRNISPIKSIFLLAGDDDQATGIIEDTIQALKSDFAESIRVDKIWISAYPDGHSSVSEDELYSTLAEKIDLIRQKNIKSGVITQITFDIKKFAQWRKNLRDLKVLTDIRASCFFKTRKSYFLGLAKLIQSNSMQDYIDTFETSFADEWLTYEGQIGEILFDLQKYSDTVNGLHFLSLGQLDHLTKTIKVLFDDSVD